jgi:hypothetical protein
MNAVASVLCAGARSFGWVFEPAQTAALCFVPISNPHYYYYYCGPGSSVGIATDYGLDGPGIESSGFGGLGVCVLASGTQDRGFARDRTCRIFLLEKSTACSTIRYKRQLKVQYQNNEAQGTNKYFKKNPGGGRDFLRTPDRLWGPPSLPYNGYRVIPGGKTARAWC